MPGDRQVVQPEALSSAGRSLQRMGSSLDEVTGMVASLDAGSAAITDAGTAAAYGEMQRIWRDQLASLARQVTALGAGLQSGSGCYVCTDESAMGGGGLQQLFGPLPGTPPTPPGG